MGIYLDDVNAIFWQSARQYTLVSAVIFLVVIAMSGVVAENITQTDESLRLSEEKFYKAFHAIPDFYTISRKKDGRYIEANDAFFRTTGYSRDEIIGQSSLDIGIWVDPAERSRMLERIAREGALHNIEATAFFVISLPISPPHQRFRGVQKGALSVAGKSAPLLVTAGLARRHGFAVIFAKQVGDFRADKVVVRFADDVGFLCA